jgi:hypothetical protein
VLAVKRVKFISERMSCITLRDFMCNTFVVNVYILTVDKRNDKKGTKFCMKLFMTMRSD